MTSLLISSFQALIIYIIFGNLFIKNNYNIQIIEKAIFGAIFISFLAVFINFFFPLNKFINTSLYIFALILFIFSKKKFFIKNYIIFFFIMLFSILIIIYDNVNTPDAYLYHLPYTQILNEEKIIIGLSNLHFRFAHISIIQYLSAINYSFLTNPSSIVVPMAIFWSLFLFFYINDLWKLIVNKESFSIGKIFSVFVLIYISYKINRYSEFGNDAIGHLSLFYLTSRFLYHKTGDKYNFYLICILTSFLIANKIFFIVAIIIPTYLIFKEKFFYKKAFFNLSSIFIIIWLIKNILISGCIIYPIEKLCINKLSWTNFAQIKREAASGEAWAKAWPQRKDKEISMENFNKNFNWIQAWRKEHLPLILKIILPFILIILISFILCFKKNKEYLIDKKIIVIILFSTIGLAIFFLKFPLYRYGYSYIIIFLVSLSLFPFYNFIDHKKFYKFCKISFIICIFAITFKQMIRIYKYQGVKKIIPRIYIYKFNDNKYTKKNLDEKFYYYLSDRECMYKYSPCTHQNPDMLKFKNSFGYKILFK